MTYIEKKYIEDDDVSLDFDLIINLLWRYSPDSRPGIAKEITDEFAETIVIVRMPIGPIESELLRDVYFDDVLLPLFEAWPELQDELIFIVKGIEYEGPERQWVRSNICD